MATAKKAPAKKATPAKEKAPAKKAAASATEAAPAQKAAPAKKKAASVKTAKTVVAKSAPAPAKKAPAKKAAAKKTATVEKAAKAAPAAAAPAAAPEAKRKVNAAFMKALTPSSALAAIVGANPLPRTEVIKQMWVYIKANKLQDAVNKQMINADAKLREVFGKVQVTMFEMAGLIGKHLK